MVVKAAKFTPEVLLSAPRRSAGIPNAAGTHAFYTVTNYSFESHSTTSAIKVLDLSTGQSTLVANEGHDPNWLGDENLIVWLQSREGGVTNFRVTDADRISAGSHVAGSVDGPLSDMKVKRLRDGTVALVIVGQAAPDGSLHNPEKAQKPHSTGRLYTSLFVRHWDTYITPNRSSLWYGVLKKSPATTTQNKGRYVLQPLRNLLNGSGLECPVSGSFAGSDGFDISASGVVFVAKDPLLNPATNTKSDFYYIPLSTFQEMQVAAPRKVQIDYLEGASSFPLLSPDGSQAVFLKQKKNGYESDKNRLIHVPDITDLSTAVEILQSEDGGGLWPLSPGSILWNNEGSKIYLLAEEDGCTKLFALSLLSEKSEELPTRLTTTGTVSDVRRLASDSDKIFMSSTNFVDNSLYAILDSRMPDNLTIISSNSKYGQSFGLSTDQVDYIWSPGAGNYEVHSWILKPSNFDAEKTYPLAFLVHGGPQGAWTNSWSTRWNPAVFAEQGYVVVCPNPTGSTGYGQDYVDGIQGQWGGRPFEDLVKCFDYIEEKLPYVDTSRAVALGGSYGGYMMNWIQGHQFGRKFRALVTHDGVFSTLSQMASDELYFPEHDLVGKFWEKRANWERWDPASHVASWATPHLVIHNELDYRLPVSEGIATFNALQDRGVPSAFLTFPDENHWVLKPENSLLWHRVVLNWINKYVGLPPYFEEGSLASNAPPGEQLRQMKL